MPPAPTLSLIVPTRGRPAQLRRFLASVAKTARRPDRIEVVLVVDDDDPASHTARHPGLTIRHTVGPAGRTMGALNAAGYEASSGEYVMLLNDDVVVRTRGWDATVLACFDRFPDRIALVHVNDTLMRDHLCVFPLVSRRFCELAGSICPGEYKRYRIDDHIEDVFNLLRVMGSRRVMYLPDVIFEHLNAVNHPAAGRVYESDPAILAEDAPRFEALLPDRKQIALRLWGEIEQREPDASQVRALESVADSFGLRTSGRQQVVRVAWWRRAPSDTAQLLKGVITRLRTRYRRDGWRGLARAVANRFGFSGSRA